VPEQNILFESV